MFDLAHYFLPYQVRWIRSEAPLHIGEKSRRIGWTYASAFRAVDRRLRLETDLFHSTTDLTAAREFIEDCHRWARLFNEIARDDGLKIIDDSGLQAFVLRFSNGSKILAGSSNPNFFRGKGGDVDADEFAFHLRARDLYKAMQPAALIWGHQMRIWSTHNGEGSFFNQLLKQSAAEKELASASRRRSVVMAGHESAGGGAGNKSAESTVPLTNQRVRSMRVTLHDAVAAGLVERIRHLREPDPVARQEFIAEVRATCPDEDAWNEEYLCRPSSEQSSLLSYALIQGCEVCGSDGVMESSSSGVEGGSGGAIESSGRGVKGISSHSITQLLHHSNTSSDCSTTPLLNHSITSSTTSLYAGFDVGRLHDRSALWVLERVGDVLWTRLVRVMGQTTFTVQEEALDELMKLRRGGSGPFCVARLCIDCTGIGAMLAERLRQRWGHRVEPIHFTAGVKSELALPLVRLFERKQIRIPADPAVREDLHSIRKGMTVARHLRLDAQRTSAGHADRFWALALANHAADQDAARLPPPVQRKPMGW